MNNELKQLSYDDEFPRAQITELVCSNEDSSSIDCNNHQLTEKVNDQETENEDDSFSPQELLKLLEFLQMNESEADQLFDERNGYEGSL